MRQTSRAKVALVTGSQPGLTQETRSLLRERLRAVALVLAIALGLFLVRGLLAGADPLRWFRLPVFFFVLGSYLLLRSHRSLTLARLRLGELVLFGLVGLQITAFHVVLTRELIVTGTPEGVIYVTLFSFMGWQFLIMTYGIFIPNTWEREAVVAAIAALIPLVVTLFLRGTVSGAAAAVDSQILFSATLLTIIAAVASVYGTYVVNVLRREVFKAKQLGQYTLEKRIGEGGMGEVYRASHAMLRRPTAIKLIRPEQEGEENLARFEREVQLTSQLTHPNTIAIYDYGRTPGGVFYYAMEYLGDGVDLHTLVTKTGPQPPARVVHILAQMAGSLAEAHDRGLVHRDIKPANVILCTRGGVRDVVKVIDFGLVKDVAQQIDAGVTQANAITGSPLYMSPEAIRSPGDITPLRDVYAVGAVGYNLLTGKELFDSRNTIEVCGLQMNEMPVAPSARLGKDLPEDLESLILECLAKDPNKRPQGAQALEERLQACSDSGTWSAASATAWWKERGGRVAPARKGPRKAPSAPANAGGETSFLQVRD